MNTLAGVFYVLYALSCLPCKQEIPQVYLTQAECQVALSLWTQQSESAQSSFFGGFKNGHSNGGHCRQEKLTQREVDTYGGVREVGPVR